MICFYSSGLTRKVLEAVEMTLPDIIHQLIADILPFCKHLHEAKEQIKSFKAYRQAARQGDGPTVVSVWDFAENYRTVFQDEPQSAFFNYQQFTLVTMCATYQCPCGAGVDESVVFLSEDNQHDSDFVEICEEKWMNEHPLNVREKKNIRFSDGCCAQFKNKKPFSKLAGTDKEYHFFGTGHGKSACDALGGMVKNCMRRDVAAGNVVLQTADDIYEYCESNLAQPFPNCSGDDHSGHKVRRFFLIPKRNPETMEANEEATAPKLYPVPNTRKLHCIKSHQSETGIVLYRQLSCTCTKCLQGLSVQCEGEWEYHDLLFPKSERMKDMGNGGKQEKEKKKRKAAKRTDPDAQIFVNVVQNASPEKEDLVKSSASDKPDPEPDVQILSEEDGLIGHAKKIGNTGKSDKGRKKKHTRQDTATLDPNVQISVKEQIEDRDTASEKKSFAKSDSTDSRDNADSMNIIFFHKLATKIRRCTTFAQLKNIVDDILLPDMPPLPPPSSLNLQSLHLDVDLESEPLVPGEFSNLKPADIFADGNCLGHTLSTLAYGSGNLHVEMRVRLIVELVRNFEDYLDVDKMTTGHADVVEGHTDYIERLFTYVELVDMPKTEMMKDIIMRTRIDGAYLNAFHLAAAANIMQSSVFSVYPLYGGYNVRPDLHRPFRPMHHTSSRIVYIMWTSITGAEALPVAWKPDHFVPLLPEVPNDSFSTLER